ncbi:glycosyltransferase [Pedobacter steynii]
MKNKTFESFIFIGSLYKQKKIFDLLYAYEEVIKNLDGKVPKLEIIGDGDEYENIKEWIIMKGFNELVILHGNLNKDEDLLPIFNRSIACISPGQAGLSVQKCFSYGVPFITSFKAITGGEITSIMNGVTGFLYDSSISELSKILLRIISGEVDIKSISTKCFHFYNEFRTVDIWKEGFLKNILRN